jgi:hypothetical protein
MYSWLRRQATYVLEFLVLLNWEEKMDCILSRSGGVLLVLGTIVHYDRPVECWLDTCSPLTCHNAETSIGGSSSRRSHADE